MPAADIWDELAIAATVDASAIRRAYAARLKRVRPDADPQGFARLRAAYEAALAAAANPAPRPNSTTQHPDADPPDAEPPDAVPPPPPRAGGPVHAALDRGDLPAAAAALAEARDADDLPLAERLRLSDRLGWALAQDRRLPLPALLEATDRLGWSNPGGADGPWGKPLAARLDAERWFATLRRQATSRWRFVAAPHALAARILLGTGRLRTLPSMGRDPTLRRRYGEWLGHAPILRDRFDPARMEAVRILLGGPATKPPGAVARAGTGVFRLTIFLLVAGSLASAVGNEAGADHDLVAGLAFGAILVAGALLRFALWRRKRSRRR